MHVSAHYQLRESILRLVESLTAGYIWHHDPFSLAITVPTEGDLEPHLEGLQVVGENASDEWLSCYLLFTITKTFQGLTARVCDNDGEFLLIEAATALPPFLSPDNSQHRVWIRSGEVHLVMPGCMVDRGKTPRTLGSGKITQLEGLKAVREADGTTTADDGVQQLIRRRIEVYPDKAAADMHHARCLLPESVAVTLRHSPELVAPAVRAYCSGDPADRNAGARMSRLLPRLTTDGRPCGTSDAREVHDGPHRPLAPQMVELRVTFTRHLYAQMQQAPVIPAPKAFRPTVGAGNLSPAAYVKAAQLGQKISMGLEAAYQRSAERHRQRTEGDIRSAVTPEKWKRMVAALNRNGFFEEEIEGSQRYREKMAIAEQFVRDNVLKVDDERAAIAEGGRQHCAVHETIDNVLKDWERGIKLDFEPPTEEDDKEDWMEVSQAELDVLFQEYRAAEAASDVSEDSDDEGSSDSDSKQQSGETPPAGTGARSEGTGKSAGGDRQDGFEDAVNELDDLVAGMNTFVADTSAGPDGAEVEVVVGDVQFDVDKFMSLFNSADLRSALDEVANEDFHGNLVPSSDDEANDEADDHDSDDNLIEKPSRMPEPAAPVTRSARSQNTDGHDESKLRFKLVEDGEPDSDDEPETTEEFSTRQVKKDEAGVPQGQPSGPASFLKEYMAAMEMEIDGSSLGQSFEKVGDYHTEEDMEKLRSVGPLDPDETPTAESWLGVDVKSKA
ncbi:unnamed protein product, partial [Sphacelaria rigidula]